jgi:hypothetical protein
MDEIVVNNLALNQTHACSSKFGHLQTVILPGETSYKPTFGRQPLKELKLKTSEKVHYPRTVGPVFAISFIEIGRKGT